MIITHSQNTVLLFLVSGSLSEFGKEKPVDPLAGSKLVLSSVIFRHGDRTPDQEEVKWFKPRSDMQNLTFYPYGLRALTNRGKQRGCSVGKWLRKRYDGWLPRIYIGDHLMVRCTHIGRTHMTALAALSALYPPDNTPLRWNRNLNWQPIPYVYEPADTDAMNHWDNCPYFVELTKKQISLPETQEELKGYDYLLPELNKACGNNITTMLTVLDINNLFKTFENVNIKLPEDIVKLRPALQNVTNIIFGLQNNDKELVRLSGGVIFDTVVTAMEEAVGNKTLRPEPRLRLFSAHENNVAAMMAAAGVFDNRQPHYGASFALELRLLNDKYFVAAVYAADPAGATAYLKVSGCGDTYLCDFDTFVELTKDARINQDTYLKLCASKPSPVVQSTRHLMNTTRYYYIE